MTKIILAVILVPCLDLWLLLTLGQYLGVWPTLAAIIATAVLGWYFAKQERIHVFNQLYNSTANGEAPGNHLVDSALVLAGGILLLLPGFISDLLGLLMILPVSRKYLREWLKQKLYTLSQSGQMRIYH